MELFLDTCAIIWLLDNSSNNLSNDTYQKLLDKGNDLTASVASLWEIELKLNKRNLEIDTVQSLSELMPYINPTGIEFIEISTSSMLHLSGVNPILNSHQDPFDKLILSEAHRLKLPLVTADNRLIALNTSSLRLQILN